MEIIKAGFKLGKRRAGETVYFRGLRSSHEQFQLRAQIATMQEGLDLPAVDPREVLGMVSDVGLVAMYWWCVNHGWTLFPVAIEPGSNDQFGLVAFDGFNEENDEPDVIQIWSEDLGRAVTYKLYCDATGQGPGRWVSEDVFERRLDFTTLGRLLATPLADDMRLLVPRGQVVANTVDGTVLVTYGTQFKSPPDLLLDWVGPHTGNLGAISLVEGRYAGNVKPDVFR